MKKKLFSLVMAVAMVLSLAVPAFAADYWNYTGSSPNTNGSPSLTMKGHTFVPTISLTLPNATGENTMILNPYRIEYNGYIVDTASTKVYSGGNDHISQLICPVYAIKSETNAKLNVKAAANATLQGEGFTLATDHIALGETAKKGFFQLVFAKKSVASSPAQLGYISTTSAMEKLDAYDTANNSVIKLTATAPTANQIPKVATVGVATASAPQYLLYQVDGEMTREPTTAWTASDKLTVNATLTFTPVSAPDSVATANNTTVFGQQKLSRDTITDTKEINLPVMKSDGTIDLKNFADFKEYYAKGTGPNIAAVNASDPKWSIVDDAGLGFTISNTGAEYKLTFAPTALNALPKDNIDHAYTFVLGYVDKNGVPRTAEVTITVGRQQ